MKCDVCGKPGRLIWPEHEFYSDVCRCPRHDPRRLAVLLGIATQGFEDDSAYLGLAIKKIRDTADMLDGEPPPLFHQDSDGNVYLG